MFKSMSRYSIFVCVVTIVCLGFSGSTAAQSGELKIGVVDLQRIIDTSEEGKRAQQEVQRKGDELAQQLQAMEDELQAMQDDYEKQKDLLTLEARSEKRDAIEKKDLEYKRFVNDAKTEFRKAEQRALKELYDEIRGIVVEYGKEQQYSLILEIQTVIYNAESIDITDEIVKVYNATKSQ